MRKISTLLSLVLFIVILASCAGTRSFARKKNVSVTDYMVYIKGGDFTMGLDNDLVGNIKDAPKKKVALKDFRISAFEVTNSEYRKFAAETGSAYEPDRTVWNALSGMQNYFERYDNHPVVGVTWEQAQAFCEWLSDTSHTYRLPTEAEWEYAARGGKENALYPWGDDIQCPDGRYLGNFKKKDGTYNHDGYQYTARIGSFPPNDFKLYDMAGNVNEWTYDSYNINGYDATDDIDPCYLGEDPPPDEKKVVRGGSWNQEEEYLECGRRQGLAKNAAYNNVGFRVVEVILPEK